MGVLNILFRRNALVKIFVPAEFDMDMLPELSKVANGQMFVRRGEKRRQDHGTKGNTCPKGRNRFIDYRGERFGEEDDALLKISRRIFRKTGRMK